MARHDVLLEPKFNAAIAYLQFIDNHFTNIQMYWTYGQLMYVYAQLESLHAAIGWRLMQTDQDAYNKSLAYRQACKTTSQKEAYIGNNKQAYNKEKLYEWYMFLNYWVDALKLRMVDKVDPMESATL